MSGERQRIRFGWSLNCSMNNQIMMLFYGFVSYVTYMSHHYNPTFSFLLVSLTDSFTPSTPSSILDSYVWHHNTLSFLHHVSPWAHIALACLSCQFRKQHRACVVQLMEVHWPISKLRKRRAGLCFSLSVWESGTLQNWMTLVNRFKSYWRGTNRQTDDMKLISFWNWLNNHLKIRHLSICLSLHTHFKSTGHTSLGFLKAFLPLKPLKMLFQSTTFNPLVRRKTPLILAWVTPTLSFHRCIPVET